MNPKAVLISLAISCVLAIIAIILLLPELRGPSIDSRPVLELRMGDVSSLGLVDEAGVRRTIERESSSWVLAWPGSTPSEPIRWPVEAGNVRGAIRLLIENLERDAQGLEVASPEATLTLGTAEGDWQIEFGASKVGGQTPVRVTDPEGTVIDARIGTQVRDVFTVNGMMAWRSAQSAVLLAAGVDRVYLKSKELAPIRLQRANDRWSLVEPLAARADDARCQQLLSTLQRLGIAKFHDTMTVASDGTGLSEPGAIVAIERDVPGEPGKRILTGLGIGTTTSLEKSHVYVAFEQRLIEQDGSASVLLGPVVTSVSVEEVNAILPFARAYLSRRTLEASVPDVRRLEVSRRARGLTELFHRSVTGWTGSGGDSVSATLSETLDDLLALVTTELAPQVELEPPEGWVEIGATDVRDASGASIGRVGLAVVERDGQVVAIATQIGGVARLYPPESHLPLMTWLRSLP